MSKNRIVLADNSYTIRRAVASSFADEENIELISLENGIGFRKKLLELKPEIVIVDVKFPKFNGYEVCRFINNTEALKDTKVYLLKGGFEPPDENSLKGLHFVDILKKPFDSNALVATIKNLLEEMPGQTPAEAAVEIPASLPEDDELPEIETIPKTPKEISFSDVKDEIDPEEILADEDELIHTPGAFPDDQVLPSEEITRAQPDKDSVSPSPFEGENPFEDKMPDEVSVSQETESGLTEEELNIKRNIEMQEREPEIPFPYMPNDVEAPDSSRKDKIAGIREEVYLLIEEVSQTKTRLEQLAKKLEDLTGNQKKGKKEGPKK
jgi:DNA-binding response OmpR family regulator